MAESKLIRDGVPAAIRATGGHPQTRLPLSEDEYWRLMHDKLAEEVNEYLLTSPRFDPRELADVYEVLLLLAAAHGVDLEELRRDKADRLGTFAGRLVWSGDREAEHG